MPHLVTLTVRSQPYSLFVSIDETGTITELKDPLKELPPAAFKLAVGSDNSAFLFFEAFKLLLPVTVPLVAHGLLKLPGFERLEGLANEWPDDVGGLGEHPTFAEGRAYAWIINQVHLALQDDSLSDYYLFDFAAKHACPLIEPYLHELHKTLDIEDIHKHEFCRRVGSWPSPKNRQIVLGQVALDYFMNHSPEMARMLQYYPGEDAAYQAMRAWDTFADTGASRMPLMEGIKIWKDPRAIEIALETLAPTEDKKKIPNKYTRKYAAEILQFNGWTKETIEEQLLALKASEAYDPDGDAEWLFRQLGSTNYPIDQRVIMNTLFPKSKTKRVMEKSATRLDLYWLSPTPETIAVLTEFLMHKKANIAAVAAWHSLILTEPETFYYNWFKNGVVEAFTKEPMPELKVTEAFIDTLKKVSEMEAGIRPSYQQYATKALANIALRTTHTEELVDYLLHRVKHPVHPKDPVYLPGEFHILYHFTDRKAEFREAYRGAVELATEEDMVSDLVYNLNFNFEDDFYLEMVARAQVLGKLEEPYEFGELILRRKRTRKRWGTERWYVSDY